MSASAVRLSRSYPVGPRYRVVFECPPPGKGGPQHITCNWSLRTPKRLSPSELTAYRQARERFLAEWMAEAGIEGNALVLET